MATQKDLQFPCTLTLRIPFPTPALAKTARQTLAVDAELSPLVRRSLSLIVPSDDSLTGSYVSAVAASSEPPGDASILRVFYAATTHRMLRVAVNGFFESLGVIVGVMEELDVDVIMNPGRERVEGMGVQGFESAKGG